MNRHESGESTFGEIRRPADRRANRLVLAGMALDIPVIVLSETNDDELAAAGASLRAVAFPVNEHERHHLSRR